MPGNTDDPSPQPSFTGRLQLQDFMYKSSLDTLAVANTGHRRSPRRPPKLLAGPPSPSPGITPARVTTHSSTPSKRKAPDGALEHSEDAPGSSSAASPLTPDSATRKKKRNRPKTGYAPPSTYAHLPLLPDAIAPNLLVLFVGLNPGLQTAIQGHAFAHPTNRFWGLLHSSGVTPRLCRAAEDQRLPELFNLGLTNVVGRPSRNGAELSKAEMDAGVSVLEQKTRRWRPEVVCIVGKSIWESVWRVRHGKAIRANEFKYGWQDESENMGIVGEEGQSKEEMEEGVDYGDGGSWSGARTFVASSTSGLAATLKPAEKQAIWADLGVWVKRRRAEREAHATRVSDARG